MIWGVLIGIFVAVFWILATGWLLAKVAMYDLNL